MNGRQHAQESAPLSTRLNDVWRALSDATGLSQFFGDPDFPPGASTELGRLLWTEPRPLIFPRKRMIVVFSPKSACSSVAIWFFHHLGHTKAARDFSAWPHQYRINVYYKSQLYRRAFESDPMKFSLVRIVRDPFERAVSSFRQVHRNGSADKFIARSLRRTDIAAKGLSFCEFLDFLDRTDLRTCDPHYSLQRHPIEDRLPTRHLINISRENLFTRLNQVEADFGLPITDFDKMKWLNNLNQSHSHTEGKSIPADAYTRRFTREAARSGLWPHYGAFLTSAARERIARLYAADIKAYGSAPTASNSPSGLALASDSD